MKHLKTYKIFESTSKDRYFSNDSQIREYLNDVFLELTDDGYKVDIDGSFFRDEVRVSSGNPLVFSSQLREEQTGYKINIKGGKSKISDIILPLDHAIEYILDTCCNRYWIDIFSGFNFIRIKNIDELENYKKYNSNNFEEIVINFRK